MSQCFRSLVLVRSLKRKFRDRKHFAAADESLPLLLRGRSRVLVPATGGGQRKPYGNRVRCRYAWQQPCFAAPCAPAIRYSPEAIALEAWQHCPLRMSCGAICLIQDQLAVWLKALMESSKNGGGILAMKSILVPTSGSDTDEPVFATALAAAQPFSAHLRFVHVRVSAGRAALHTPHVEFARGPSVVDWKSCSWRLTRGQLRRDSISANFAHIPELRWWTCPAPRTW